MFNRSPNAFSAIFKFFLDINNKESEPVNKLKVDVIHKIAACKPKFTDCFSQK